MNQAGYSSQSTAIASKKRTLPVFSENMLYKTGRNKIDIRQLVSRICTKERISFYYFITC